MVFVIKFQIAKNKSQINSNHQIFNDQIRIMLNAS